MARFTGAGNFATVIEMGVTTGRMVLSTDEGPIRVTVTGEEGDIVSGQTEDGRLVTIDKNDPDNITIS